MIKRGLWPLSRTAGEGLVTLRGQFNPYNRVTFS
jgi:hypothetical protein